MNAAELHFTAGGDVNIRVARDFEFYDATLPRISMKSPGYHKICFIFL